SLPCSTARSASFARAVSRASAFAFGALFVSVIRYSFSWGHCRRSFGRSSLCSPSLSKKQECRRRAKRCAKKSEDQRDVAPLDSRLHPDPHRHPQARQTDDCRREIRHGGFDGVAHWPPFRIVAIT